MSETVDALYSWGVFQPPVSREGDDRRTLEAFTRHTILKWVDDETKQSMSTFVGYIGEPHSSNPLLLCSYGSAEDSHCPGTWEMFRDIHLLTKMTVVVYDYPGYGPYAHQSPRQRGPTWITWLHRMVSHVPNDVPIPSGHLMYVTGERVFEHIRNTYRFRPIYLWGRSLGTTVTVHLMCRYARIKAIERAILISPPMSGLRYLTGLPSVNVEFLDCFRAYDEILRAHPRIPTYLVQAENDELIKPFNVEAFKNAMGNQALVLTIPDRDHNNVNVCDLLPVLQWLVSPRTIEPLTKEEWENELAFRQKLWPPA